MAIHKVMLVDDDPEIRAVAGLCLERIGRWQVVLAGSGAQALEFAARERPDVLLLDVQMPDMTGPALFRALRQRPECATTPGIFLTATSGKQELDGLRALGALGIIQKPFDPVGLARDVQRLVDAEGGCAVP